jgi:hypothetical protein
MTIGEHIEKLVAEYGNNTMMIYCLESALKEICGMKHGGLKINGKLVHYTPGYIKLKLEENAICRKIKSF